MPWRYAWRAGVAAMCCDGSCGVHVGTKKSPSTTNGLESIFLRKIEETGDIMPQGKNLR
jgi:hypothetical protein